MQCPDKANLIFYILNEFQLAEEKTRIESHLSHCKQCAKLVDKLNYEIGGMMKENERDCEASLLNLKEVLAGETKNPNINSHLAECERCRFMWDEIKPEYDFESIQEKEIPVPERLTKRIEQLLKSVQKQQPAIEDLRKRIERASDVFFELFIAPSPAAAFLGQYKTGEAIVEIKGERVEFAVGKPDIIMKLCSLDNSELDRQKSDENGCVIFENIFPGSYKISIDGFEIKKVKYYSD